MLGRNALTDAFTKHTYGKCCTVEPRNSDSFRQQAKSHYFEGHYFEVLLYYVLTHSSEKNHIQSDFWKNLIVVDLTEPMPRVLHYAEIKSLIFLPKEST